MISKVSYMKREYFLELFSQIYKHYQYFFRGLYSLFNKNRKL